MICFLNFLQNVFLFFIRLFNNFRDWWIWAVLVCRWLIIFLDFQRSLIRVMLFKHASNCWKLFASLISIYKASVESVQMFSSKTFFIFSITKSCFEFPHVWSIFLSQYSWTQSSLKYLNALRIMKVFKEHFVNLRPLFSVKTRARLVFISPCSIDLLLLNIWNFSIH